MKVGLTSSTGKAPQCFIVLSTGKTEDAISYSSTSDYAKVRYLGVYEGKHVHLFSGVGQSLADSKFHGDVLPFMRAWKKPLLRLWLKKKGVVEDPSGNLKWLD